jgi:hypothetical protein
MLGAERGYPSRMNVPRPSTLTDPDASKLLRDLLELVDIDAHVVCLAKDPVANPGAIYRDYGVVHEPTHVVLDGEGEVVGRGLSEDSAVADAIKHYHREATRELAHVRSAVRAWKQATNVLAGLG